MRIFISIALLLIGTVSKAQSSIPGSFIDNNYRGNFAANIRTNDSIYQKKWFVSKYSGISTSFLFFKGGNATVISAPLGLQLNRRLTNNVFVFAGASITPAYVNFNSFMNSGYNKTGLGNSFNSARLGLNARAELGLMYINDEKTFSISGSIGIERNSYPMPFYNNAITKQNLPVTR